MMRLRLVNSLLIALAVATGCGLGHVPDLPSLENGGGDPGLGTGGSSASTGGGFNTGGEPGPDLGGASSDPPLSSDGDFGGMGGQR